MMGRSTMGSTYTKRVLAALTAAGLIAGAVGGPAASASTVASASQTYTPGGDFVTVCSGSLGVGGGCFTPAPGATSVQASLTDAVSASPGGSIVFRDAGGHSLSAASFCGASGPVAIPPGTAHIFVYAEEQALGSACGVATTGTVTLRQSNPQP